jgi:recombination protein RecA
MARKIRRTEDTADVEVLPEASASSALTESIVTAVRSVNPEAASVMTEFEDCTTSAVKKWIPTGFRWLDMVMSQGRGIPCGKIIEIYGMEGTGKTAICQYLIRHYQKLGGTAVYLDFETSLNSDHLAGYGIDPANLIYVDAETMEDGFDYVMAVFNKLSLLPEEERGKPILIIWDSVAMSPPKAESEEQSIANPHIALMARAMSKGCRKIRRKIAKTNCTMIFTNQARVDIGAMYGDKLTVPGGKALRFASSVRMKLARIKTLTVNKRGMKKPIGYVIEADIKKTRFAPPHQRAQFILSFKDGPNPELSMMHYLKEIGLIRKAGKSSVFIPLKETIEKGGWKAFYKENKKAVRAAIEEREKELFLHVDDDSEDGSSESDEKEK